MERWSIKLEKPYHSFSAAHFLIFPDGSAERLHGHNYRVYVDLDATLSRYGLVLDFKKVKPVVRELVDELDEHWLLPAEHAELRIERDDGAVHVTYRDRRYRAPAEDVLEMPMNNISAENLAAWLGRQLRARLTERFDDLEVRSLTCSVEETPGQRGVYHYEPDDA